jgi:putative ABC transport system permease protein
MKHQPPRFARQLLQWFCHAEFIEEVEGDLYELFQYRVEHSGPRAAKLGYLRDVLNSINRYRSRPRKVTKKRSLSTRDELSHFFKVAIRNLLRSKTSSIVNLTGLAVSITCFLLISIYLVDELTFDSYHPDPGNVYRIGYSFKSFDGTEGKDSRAAGLWSVALKEEMPEVINFTRFSRFGYPGKVWRENPNNVFIEQQFFWVDSTLTDIFSIPLAGSGSIEEILRNPGNVIINQSIAKKYFGTTDPIGQSITYVRDGLDFPFTVAGIIKDPPTNTHFRPDFIASSLALNPLWKQNGGVDRINSWTDSFSYSIINLQPGTDLNKVSDALQDIFNKHLGHRASTTRAVLIPLRDIHFSSGLRFELDRSGDINHLYIFGSVGLLILGMASMNYINLATARSIRRSKEVGLRKTLGTNRLSLIIHFIGESMLMTAFAFVIAVVLFVLFLPAFNDLTGKSFTMAHLLTGKMPFVLGLTVALIGILSGVYPAFYLSGFKPISVLRGTLATARGQEYFRKTLVIVQITITVLLLSGTYVIHSQLEFIDRGKLSEFKDQIITVRLGNLSLNSMPELIQTATQDPRVKEISFGPHLPRLDNFGNISRSYHFDAIGVSNLSIEQFDTDFDFPKMFNLEFIAGRDFSKDNPADTSAIILNERAVRDLGISPANAIGLLAEDVAYYEQQGQMVPVTTQHKVIGVVKDFNYASVHRNIEPMAIQGQWKSSDMMYVRLSGVVAEYGDAIDKLSNAWKKAFPATPFQYWFMDQEFGRLYQRERQMGDLFVCLAGMAILIACLGLFGLASFTAEQKTREIGIRKVLGASSLQMLILLTSRYVKLALVAFIIGVPIAFFVIRSWMETFVYKADPGISYYIWSCLLVVSIIVVTVSVESLRAARSNPSDSIRHE